MSPREVICPDCSQTNGYWAVQCRCGCFLGFPNRRAAAEEAAELDKRYNDAVISAGARSVAHHVLELEKLAQDAQPVICMSLEIADDLMRSAKYRNYHHLVDQGVRDPAEKGDDAVRTMVGTRLFPAYFQHIHYAALSPNGRGLTSYGNIALSWKVTENYLERRISVHEENSYDFFEKHELGKRSATVPVGYAGVWTDRRKVVIAKLAPRLTGATASATLPSMLLRSATSRSGDDFIEIAVYADQGLDTIDVDCVTVQSRGLDARRLQLLEESCAKRSPPIAFRL
jgi:hypothetical protein